MDCQTPVSGELTEVRPLVGKSKDESPSLQSSLKYADKRCPEGKLWPEEGSLLDGWTQMSRECAEDERLEPGRARHRQSSWCWWILGAEGEAGPLDSSPHCTLRAFTEGSWVSGLRIFTGPFPDNVDAVLLGR